MTCLFVSKLKMVENNVFIGGLAIMAPGGGVYAQRHSVPQPLLITSGFLPLARS